MLPIISGTRGAVDILAICLPWKRPFWGTVIFPSLPKLMSYHWPGNIRELEHLIERSVLLEKGTMIENIALPITLKSMEEPATGEIPMKTIHENERDYIVAVLKKCNGRIWGPGAAAEVLNIPPSTLKSKM